MHQDTCGIRIGFEEAQAMQRYGAPLPLPLKRDFDAKRMDQDAGHACAFLTAFIIGNISRMEEVCSFQRKNMLLSLSL